MWTPRSVGLIKTLTFMQIMKSNFVAFIQLVAGPVSSIFHQNRNTTQALLSRCYQLFLSLFNHQRYSIRYSIRNECKHPKHNDWQLMRHISLYNGLHQFDSWNCFQYFSHRPYTVAISNNTFHTNGMIGDTFND